jgi:hypothetical protein
MSRRKTVSFARLLAVQADRKQGCSQVSEDLVSLRWKIDEDDATGPHVHDLRIAGRGAKLGGIEASNRFCLAFSHKTSSWNWAITVSLAPPEQAAA